MSWPAKPLCFHAFGVGDPIDDLGDGRARNYLRCYLADLGASTVIEEPYYFDRDYLAEFATFYSTSSRGYPNICRRLHFFGGDPAIDRALLEAAAGGDVAAHSRMQQSYLGFAVLRPFEPPRLGRTVLAWYPDQPPAAFGSRVIKPSRDYEIHLAGLVLHVHGLAWQQQDASVGTCATVALWSMLHSSAFDDHHAIPTTASITQSAHRAGSLGRRVFPSAGLTAQQLCEAVHAQGLSPVLLEGDLQPYFSVERFASSCAAFIRSGYPILVAGELRERVTAAPLPGTPAHAICLTGFRDCPPATGAAGSVALADAAIPIVYGHDDNLGPNVRFSLTTHPTEGFAVITPDAPPPRVSSRPVQDPTTDYPSLAPHALLVAVHNDLRSSPDTLHEVGLTLAKTLSLLFSGAAAAVAPTTLPQVPAVSLSTRFIGVREYMRDELPRLLASNAPALSRVRLALLESVEPMSLHLGLVRLGLGAQPLVDVLYDTTDSEISPRAFAHIALAQHAGAALAIAAQVASMAIGRFIDGS